MSEDFVGSGWAFPMRLDASGGVALVSSDFEIREAIRLVLATAPGERPMRPEFGCQIHDYVFTPADAATAGRIAHEVRQSLERWEPRIEVTLVNVSLDDTDPSKMYIEVAYTIRGSNDPRNLVFPFYVIPDEG